MPAYRYRAFDAEGRRQNGVIEADSAKQARAQLRDNGLLPDQLDEVAGDKPATGTTERRVRKVRVSRADLGIVTQQLATLLAAGLTVEQALSALIEQVGKDSVREVLAGIRTGVKEGESLAKAMERYGEVFDPLYRALVDAGEISGELPLVIERLAAYAENVETFRQKTLLAFLYPAIVTVVAVLVIGGLVAYVVPQVVQVFEQSKQTLPLLTRMLVAVSDIVRHGWWIMAGVLAALIFAGKAALRDERRRLRLHTWLLGLPGFGYLLSGVDSIRLSNTLAILIGSGIPMLTALRAGSAVLGNLALRQALDETAQRVREGMNLSRALARSKRFPPILVHLIASGEASGRLGYMLERAARQQEKELQNRIAVLTGLLEPALIVVMGGVVMVVVLAILLPIIDINQLLTKH